MDGHTSRERGSKGRNLLDYLRGKGDLGGFGGLVGLGHVGVGVFVLLFELAHPRRYVLAFPAVGAV